jgi:hypothetical protein
MIIWLKRVDVPAVQQFIGTEQYEQRKKGSDSLAQLTLFHAMEHGARALLDAAQKAMALR